MGKLESEFLMAIFDNLKGVDSKLAVKAYLFSVLLESMVNAQDSDTQQRYIKDLKVFMGEKY